MTAAAAVACSAARSGLVAARSAGLGSDWNGILAGHVAVVARLAGWPACDRCGGQPCANPAFCAACRRADQARARQSQREPEQRPTPLCTIEAIMHAVLERGPKA